MGYTQFCELQLSLFKALAVLAPLYGRFGDSKSPAGLGLLQDAPGLVGKPNLPRLNVATGEADDRPWVRAVTAAQELRRKANVFGDKISYQLLRDLMGIQMSERWKPLNTHTSAVGIPMPHGKVRFVPRKTHPNPRRFEMARFLGDLVHTGGSSHWLASTDLLTARQKFQRAFAAEFLCPADLLPGFRWRLLRVRNRGRSFHFSVGELTVRLVLATNGRAGLEGQFGRHGAFYG